MKNIKPRNSIEIITDKINETIKNMNKSLNEINHFTVNKYLGEKVYVQPAFNFSGTLRLNYDNDQINEKLKNNEPFTTGEVEVYLNPNTYKLDKNIEEEDIQYCQDQQTLCFKYLLTLANKDNDQPYKEHIETLETYNYDEIEKRVIIGITDNNSMKYRNAMKGNTLLKNQLLTHGFLRKINIEDKNIGENVMNTIECYASP